MTSPALYRVLAPRGAEEGGKRVAVFADADGDLQARAASAGAPLSVFVDGANASAERSGLRLRVLTPERERNGSDSASLAALAWLQEQGRVGDVAEVQTGQDCVPAQLCGGEWLLLQGAPSVRETGAAVLSQVRADLGLPQADVAHLAQTQRPNLVLALPDLAALDAFVPDADQISALGQATGSTGLILYALDAPAEGPQRRADVSFRTFGPLRGFLEDAASSQMAACLVAVLGARGRWPAGAQALRAAQRFPGQPALLTAQFSAPGEAVWVGGRAERLT
ncbi:Predicted epimerase YddE/YHI9, PhzF superfamily [Deinococcus reticulitermitis]|uniref:Predicted epimerase YddE/YHI9, PhzF superfamily n=1 Tax=Deinococcus reticulitermitis TaxID=856736 RepID=A0A1H6V2F4_9DEIO|nr:PhzF family phenazine biosynthesis protein [Deinococcus reticulitermitis]SEI98753.1 Predicted epimerase YddE/YHI9, PhzF superfamily [Deinococcus reticulitermitis]